MMQVLQSLGDGSTAIVDVPVPVVRPGTVVVRTRCSLISAGTERMLVDFGRGSLVSKARQQPERVREVFAKVRTDGALATYDAITSKLDHPIPLGYSNVGRVLQVGAGVEGLSVGDRVVSNGPHAEAVCVPKNLVAPVPDSVSDEAASFTVVGAIGLQGVRLLEPTFGECFVVTGLGLVGLVAAQLLLASGCRVLGLDTNPARCALARSLGIEAFDVGSGADPVDEALRFSRGRGVDGVLLCASTDSSEPVRQGARMCRSQGRLVLVGVTGLELNRADFYEREISFRVSCSYGPGRYDPAYEEGGQDYPIGHVRWTEQRNFEAVLDALSTGSLNVEPLTSHRFGIEEAAAAYDALTQDPSALGIVLRYPNSAADDLSTVPLQSYRPHPREGLGVLGLIGAGNYGGRVLAKAFAAAEATLHTIVSGSGVGAVHYGRRTGFAHAASDPSAVLAAPSIDMVCIATRHASHASLVEAALVAGKHVFVEKPLCLTSSELESIEAAYAASSALLMVGFNRRFSPHVVRMRELLDTLAVPPVISIAVNAGRIAGDHWTQDPSVGGGRIVGEACHFVDLARHLAGAPISEVQVVGARMPGGPRRPDTAIISLRFDNGAIASIQYFANGHRAVPKERIEVSAAGRVLQLDNFRKLSGHGWGRPLGPLLLRQDKGQRQCVSAFVQAVREQRQSPIPFAEIREVSLATLKAADALD